MAFIEKTDYKDTIRENMLDDITEVDDEIIDLCEARAISFMEGYLNNRYDVETIFAAVGAARNPVILGMAKDIAVYYMHRLNNWRKIPAGRKDAFQEAKEWLEKVSEQRINPRELPLLADGSKDYILYGSNPKRENHI